MSFQTSEFTSVQPISGARGPSVQPENPTRGPSVQPENPTRGPSMQAESPARGPSMQAESPARGPSTQAESPARGPSTQLGSPARGPNTRAPWKSHIMKQLKRRDHTQKNRFNDLIHTYNKLLEKSALLMQWTEKLQADPMGSPSTHFTRLPCDSSGHPPAAEDAHAQTEIAELVNYNGELAYEACTLKKQVLERDNQLKEQSCSINRLQESAAARCAQRDRLSEDVRLTELDNSELKVKYDKLLLDSQELEEALRNVEMKHRDLIETMTRQKALEAENQNQVNERIKIEIWRYHRKKALRKAVSAESDVGSHGPRSPDAADSPEGDNQPSRRCRSQSIPLGPSKFISAIRNFFDFNSRKEREDCYGPEDWYPSPSVCVICSLPKRALCNKEVHDSEVHAVKFCPNSRVVATGGADRVVKLWEVTGGMLQEHQTLEGSHGGITSIEFDPSGVQILAASFDGAAHLWKMDSKTNDSLTGHKGKVTAAKFKMCPYRAVTSSLDRTVKEWDLQKVACIRSISVSSYCSDVVCSDACIISGHHDRKIRFWDSRSESCIREVALEDKVTSLFLGQDQTQLLSCSRDDALSIIDLRTSSVQQVFRADGFKCGCDWTKAILSPDGSYAIAGSADGNLFIWNTQTGILERSLNGQHSASVSAITWSASGDYVVSVDRGKKAVLWSEF